MLYPQFLREVDQAKQNKNLESLSFEELVINYVGALKKIGGLQSLGQINDKTADQLRDQDIADLKTYRRNIVKYFNSLRNKVGTRQ